MARSKRCLATVLYALALSSCIVGDPSRGVGDPCLPQQPAAGTDDRRCGDAGCFRGTEVYLETASLQCRSHACVVYHWDQGITAEAQNERAFCTCRCGGGAAGDSACNCPDGFQCTTLFGGAGNPEVQGSYCIRSSLRPQ